MSLMETPPRETTLEAGGLVKGVAVALVTQNDDPEKLCRVKVRYPWHDKPSESYWARLAAPIAGTIVTSTAMGWLLKQRSTADKGVQKLQPRFDSTCKGVLAE